VGRNPSSVPVYFAPGFGKNRPGGREPLSLDSLFSLEDLHNHPRNAGGVSRSAAGGKAVGLRPDHGRAA